MFTGYYIGLDFDTYCYLIANETEWAENIITDIVIETDKNTALQKAIAIAERLTAETGVKYTPHYYEEKG